MPPRVWQNHAPSLTSRSVRRAATGTNPKSILTVTPPSLNITRCITALAIETSCDDTAVAIVEQVPSGRVKVHFNEKVTANTDAFKGIHPLVALHSHQSNLAPLVRKALRCSPRPDFVAATRGPGMRSNLSVGLDTAKGLALGLNVPFLGIHHMQAHTLTPRLVSAMLESARPQAVLEPQYPFLTMLASGGHTTFLSSAGLTEHSILAETQDLAIGDFLDKVARAIVPEASLKTPFGKALEDFAFPQGSEDYAYIPPARRQDELEARKTNWGWTLRPPFAESKGGEKTSRRMAFSFAGLLSSIERFLTRKVDANGRLTDQPRSFDEVGLEERRDMARDAQRVAFEHLASRLLLHLTSVDATKITTVVVSGGVAANGYLRHVLRAVLDVRGFGRLDCAFPPIALCTDNALMIAWAALEMWHAGYRCSLDIQPLRKWSLDPEAEDGGILGVGGWIEDGSSERRGGTG